MASKRKQTLKLTKLKKPNQTKKFSTLFIFFLLLPVHNSKSIQGMQQWNTRKTDLLTSYISTCFELCVSYIRWVMALKLSLRYFTFSFVCLLVFHAIIVWYVYVSWLLPTKFKFYSNSIKTRSCRFIQNYASYCFLLFFTSVLIYDVRLLLSFFSLTFRPGQILRLEVASASKKRFKVGSVVALLPFLFVYVGSSGTK